MDKMTMGSVVFGPPGPGKSPDLAEVLKHAVAARKAMSLVDGALHDAEQRRSWVRGMSGRDPGQEVLAAEVERLRGVLRQLYADYRVNHMSKYVRDVAERALRQDPAP